VWGAVIRRNVVDGEKSVLIAVHREGRKRKEEMGIIEVCVAYAMTS